MEQNRILLEEKVMTFFKPMAYISFFLIIPYSIFLILFHKDPGLFILGLLAGNIAYIISGVLLLSFERKPLRIYYNYLELPVTRWGVWDKAWGLPEDPKVYFNEIERITGENGHSIFIELKDARRYLIFNGTKKRVNEVFPKIEQIFQGKYK